MMYEPETTPKYPFSKLPKLFSSSDVLECVPRDELQLRKAVQRGNCEMMCECQNSSLFEDVRRF